MTTLVWSERNEPGGGPWRDCTYSSGLQALVFGGFTKFPRGAYTVAEREALERSDNQPNETGASLDDLILAVHNRYAVDLTKSRTALLVRHHARSDLAFVIQGVNGALPRLHRLRRWDRSFAGAHCVTVIPTGDGTHLRWLDPLAPNRFAGDITDWATVTRWMGGSASCISVRKDAYAPPRGDDMTEQLRLTRACTTIAARYLPAAVKRDNDADVVKWSSRLADYATRIAVLSGAPLDEDEVETLARASAPAAVAPNFGDSRAMSSGLYNEWVAAWWIDHFGEGGRAVDYGTVAAAAVADGCLAQVCAAGKLGSPAGPVPDLGDWSLYTAYTSTTDDDGLTHRVYHMGKLVGTQVGGDGLEFAHSLGFDW